MFLERMMRFFNGFPVVSAPKSMKEVKIDFRAYPSGYVDYRTFLLVLALLIPT